MDEQVSQHESGNMNASQISLSDLQIPRVMAMQQLSQQVSEGTASIGDFVASDDGTILGSIKAPLEFIPLFCKKTYRVSNEETKEFISFEQYDYDRPYKQERNGINIINTLVYNFYCILPKFPTMPYIIAFKGMSKNAGATLFTKTEISMRMARLDPWERIFELTGVHIKEKNKNYVQLSYTNSKKTIDAETSEVVNNWLKMLGIESKKNSNLKIGASNFAKPTAITAQPLHVENGEDIF